MLQTVNFEIVCDVISSSLISNSTPIDGRVVYSCHGDLEVASIVRDPDVLVVVEGEARAVTEPDELR